MKPGPLVKQFHAGFKLDYIWACSIDLMDLKRIDPINKGIKEMEEKRKRVTLPPRLWPHQWD